MGEYLTVGEFERTMQRVEKSISEGFSTTHEKQDKTNGRLQAAERTLEVLSKARLIDRVANNEQRLGAIETRAKVVGGAKRVLITLSCTVVGGIVVGVTVAFFKWKFGL